MKNSIALLTFLAISSVAIADPPPDAKTPLAATQSVSRVASDVEPITVTGNRPRSLDRTSDFVGFRSVVPRTLSTPLAFQLLTEPVLLTVRTGNTEELRANRFEFPFESVQDSTVRNSDVLKIRLAEFKLD